MSAGTRHPMQPSAEFASGVLTTAVEGGSNYWASIRNVVRAQDLFVISAWFRDSESRDPYKLVDAGQVAQGIARLADSRFKINVDLRRLILSAVAEDDAGSIDADAADVIVQAAVYGEIVFG